MKTDIIPRTTTEIVYIMRLSTSVAVAMPAGIPSAIMKYAEAGCPPVADGVIAAHWSQEDFEDKFSPTQEFYTDEQERIVFDCCRYSG